MYCKNQKQLQQLKNNVDLQILPGDVDVTNQQVISRVKPRIVIHAAATKFVGLSEKFPNGARCKYSWQPKCFKVIINNKVDYVLNFNRQATSPIENFMSPAVMEKLFTLSDGEYNTRFSSVRYGNVTWSTGSVFPWEDMTNKDNQLFLLGLNE